MVKLNDVCLEYIHYILSGTTSTQRADKIIKQEFDDILFIVKCLAIHFEGGQYEAENLSCLKLKLLAKMLDDYKKDKHNDQLVEMMEKFSEMTKRIDEILSGPDYPEGIKMFNEAKAEFNNLKNDIDKN